MANDAHPDRWKHKYFSALEELEEKEKAWVSSEEVFRRGMGRLALISQGADPSLDRRLKNLRKTLQKGDNIGRIDQLVEEVSERVKVLDEANGGKGIPRPHEVLEKILGTISFPKPLKRQAKKLQKRLSSADAEAHMAEYINEFSVLVASSVQEAGEVVQEEGLFSRLFGKGKAEAGRPVPEPATKESALDEPAAARDRTTEARPVEAESSTAPRSQGDLRLLEGVYIEFLEHLTFPSEFSSRVQSLKEQLETGIELSEVKLFTQGLITLIVDVRKGLEAEKEELEKFLQQLTQRLQDLDSMIEGAQTHRIASLESGRHLDALVYAQVTDIEKVVNSATELDQMKLEIQSSLDSIRDHLSDQRSQEEQNSAGLELQLKQMTERLKQMEDESAHLKKRLEIERENALTDPLTGAPNRLAYDQRIAQEFSRWKRHKYPLSMLLMDIDHFKNINDTYGHKAGDRALKSIVQALRQHVRASDFMARVGGEEFVLLLPETDIEGAYQAAEKLRRGIEACEFAYKGQSVPITISGGVAQFKQGDSPDSVYILADDALYRAKQQGRNQFQKENRTGS